MTSDSVTDAAGRALARWAAREAYLRAEAASDWPTHLQYAGEGRLLLIGDACEVVWPLELTGGFRA